MIAKDIQFIEVFCADDEAIDLEFQTNNKNKANEIWLLSYYIKTHIINRYAGLLESKGMSY